VEALEAHEWEDGAAEELPRDLDLAVDDDGLPVPAAGFGDEELGAREPILHDDDRNSRPEDDGIGGFASGGTGEHDAEDASYQRHGRWYAGDGAEAVRCEGREGCDEEAIEGVALILLTRRPTYRTKLGFDSLTPTEEDLNLWLLKSFHCLNQLCSNVTSPPREERKPRKFCSRKADRVNPKNVLT